jgi:hypothetical protein
VCGRVCACVEWVRVQRVHELERLLSDARSENNTLASQAPHHTGPSAPPARPL